MTFTTDHKAIVQATFAMVSDADALAATFYTRLFEIDPSTRYMFHGDMKQQRQKLMQTIAVVVNNLNDLSTIVPAIQSLGKRHVAYGVTVEHWDSVGAALLWTLAETFGEAFTDDIRDAWAAAYGLIAQTAIAAAYPQIEEEQLEYSEYSLP